MCGPPDLCFATGVVRNHSPSFKDRTFEQVTYQDNVLQFGDSLRLGLLLPLG